MFGIQGTEIAIILVVALLILGPKRLPELARGIGKFVSEFRRQTDEVRSVVQDEFYRMDKEIEKYTSLEPGTPTAPAREGQSVAFGVDGVAQDVRAQPLPEDGGDEATLSEDPSASAEESATALSAPSRLRSTKS